MGYADLVPAPINILAVSGSVRAASTNGAMLRAAAKLAPEGMTFSYYEGLDSLPHFNPDLDDEGAPQVPTAGQ